jgi:hypothetical protein
VIEHGERAGRRAPITHSEPSAAMRAKAALFAMGFELAGVKLQRFAERLVQAADASPEASAEDLVRTAVEDIEDGAIALVAEEPELRDRRLARAATTVSDAADGVVYEVGVALLDAHGPRMSRPAAHAAGYDKQLP